MALTSCAECGAKISTDAAACPQCGVRRKKSRRMLWLPVGALAGLAVILVASNQIGEAKAEKNKQACAAAITEAIRQSSTAEEANAIVRADPRTREVCADFEMNGVPIAP